MPLAACSGVVRDEEGIPTGERRRFDLSPHLDAGVFQELCQRKLFEQARAERWGVSWPTGQDLSRDTLYLEGVPVVETDLETSI